MHKISTMVQRIGRAGTVLGALIILGLAGQASAFDGQPAATDGGTAKSRTPFEALISGIGQYKSGDKAAALSSLQYAAENGQLRAAWKLGKMYAKGDGVPEDDIKAFEYFSQIVRDHGEDHRAARDAPFVSSAFVALGYYYLYGIEGALQVDRAQALRNFTTAATYYRDANAQFELGQIYQESNALSAVRWYNLAAEKGHVGAQARLGEILYSRGKSDQNKALGLKWMTIARDQADPADAALINGLHEQYFALSSESVRKLARSMADDWLQKNRPDIKTAQQVTPQ
jgi:TPR repeat protein